MGVLSLLVKLGVDSTAFEMGLKRAQGLGEKFGNSFKNAVTSRLSAALSVAAVTSFAHSVAQAADRVGELAEQLNISTDDVQKLEMAAKLYGVKFEAVASAIVRINDARTAALSTDGAQRAAFEKLGMSVSFLSDRSLGSEQVLMKLGETLNANKNNADMMAAAADLLGLKLTKAAMAAGTVKDLGPIDLFKAEDIKTIEKFNDQMDLLIKKTQVQSIEAAKASYNIAEIAFGLFKMTEAGKAAAFASKLSIAPAATILDLASGSSRLLGQNAAAKSAAVSSATGKAGDRFIPPEMILAAIRGEKFALGGAQDSLARIGGFTGFQTQQDVAIKQAVEQTLQLKLIAKSTEKTAQVISRD
jgi:hypothetical protein